YGEMPTALSRGDDQRAVAVDAHDAPPGALDETTTADGLPDQEHAIAHRELQLAESTGVFPRWSRQWRRTPRGCTSPASIAAARVTVLSAATTCRSRAMVSTS